jgi:hypothetical protein
MELLSSEYKPVHGFAQAGFAWFCTLTFFHPLGH